MKNNVNISIGNVKKMKKKKIGSNWPIMAEKQSAEEMRRKRDNENKVADEDNEERKIKAKEEKRLKAKKWRKRR